MCTVKHFNNFHAVLVSADHSSYNCLPNENLMNNNETYYTYVPTLACEINVTHGSLLQ